MSRSLSVLLLVSCATAPALDAGTPAPFPLFPPVADAPKAPPGPLVVTLPALVAGDVASITVAGLEPGERGHLVSSRWGLGSGPCLDVIGGLCLDVVGPIYYAGNAVADGAGTATVDVYLPPHLDGVELCFDGIARRDPGPSVKGTATCAVVGDGGGPVCVPEDEIWGDGLDQDCDGHDQVWAEWQTAWTTTCGREEDGPWHCVGIPSFNSALDLSDATVVEFAYGMVCKIDDVGDAYCDGSYTNPGLLYNAGPWVDIGAGMQSSVACFLDPAGGVACFGDDGGDGRLSPAAGTYTSVDTGQYHACGQHPDGTLSCWGASGGHWQDYDQVDGTPGTVFAQYSTGQRHNCAVTDAGAVSCWGRGVEGQTTVPPGTYSKVAAGNYHSCGLLTDGSITCWGTDNWLDAPFESPLGSDFVDVLSGPDHACGEHADGTLECWGNDQAGETVPPFHEEWTTLDLRKDGTDYCGVTVDGYADCGGVAYPRLVPDVPVLDISVQENSMCWVLADGTLACSGAIDAPPAGTFTEVDIDDYLGCARDGAGYLTCWDATADAPAEPVSTFAVGAGIACALTSADGTLSCWGPDPAVPSTPVGSGYLDVAAGNAHACAIDAAGELTCWGSNSAGQLDAPAGTWMQVGAGFETSCAVAVDGTVTCWGDDSRGVASDVPVEGVFVEVEVGNFSACARRPSGRVACWGGRGRPVP